jgi:hypothetical protein
VRCTPSARGVRRREALKPPDPVALLAQVEHVATTEERGATEELAAAFAEVGMRHGLSPYVYSERCEIARIMARGRHPAYQRHRHSG